MLIFTKTAELSAFLSEKKSQGKSIGFVPTMGALHAGHMSLVETSKRLCDLTLCSIFVNPTQFNDKTDLANYPRMPEKDLGLLESAACDAVFMPSVEEMYPDPAEKAVFDFGALGRVLEGVHRPGHFNGVAQIVKRFFELIGPDKAFFGSKDYQQAMIVKALAKQMHSGIEIVTCPILREPDGLAMSSRNALLSREERQAAAEIPVMMKEAKEIVLSRGIAPAKAFIRDRVAKVPGMKLEYYEVADAESLALQETFNPSVSSVSLIAVFTGKIRLIDNLILN